MSDAIGAVFHAQMKEVAASAVLKCYIKYLVKSGLATSADAVREKIGELVTSALNRGAITQEFVERLNAKLDHSCLFLKTMDACHAKEKFIDMSLIRCLMHIDVESMSGEDAALMNEAKECFAHLIELRNKLVTRYGDLFLGLCLSFYGEYKNLFDPGFEKLVRELVGSVDDCPHVAL